jgi:hypothetical protein
MKMKQSTLYPLRPIMNVISLVVTNFALKRTEMLGGNALIGYRYVTASSSLL